MQITSDLLHHHWRASQVTLHYCVSADTNTTVYMSYYNDRLNDTSVLLKSSIRFFIFIYFLFCKGGRNNEKDDHTPRVQFPRVSSFVQNPQILQLQTSATKQIHTFRTFRFLYYFWSRWWFFSLLWFKISQVLKIQTDVSNSSYKNALL